MPGALIPPWYHKSIPTTHDVVLVSIIWGVSLGLSAFGVIRAGNQTYHQFKRTKKVTAYMAFIWLELIASTIIGGISWGFVYNTIPPCFEIYFFILVLWVFQIQCIMQIILNRISLLAVNHKIVRRLKWGVFIVISLINISVFCIWLPARLQISQRYININNIWDRIEKSIFACIDASLNAYFIYLVRSTLISYGLTKYVVLYRFNLCMIFISVSMDVLIITMMSLNNSFLYVLFHPLAYLVKLHIELSMAELIAKIVKASGPALPCHCACHSTHFPNRHELNTIIYPSGQSSGRMAPTTGRFRRILWPGWHRTRAGHNTGPQSQMTERRKVARSERPQSQRFSWLPFIPIKESVMTSLSSSQDTASTRNEHQV